MNEATTFDPDLFMHSEVSSPNEVHYTPLPEAEYEDAYVDTVANPRKAGESVVMDVFFEIKNEDVRAALDREKVTSKLSVWLDFDEYGGLAFGENKNVTLGRLREALGQNTGEPWSPSMMIGCGPCKVLVVHKTDKEDPTIKRDQIKRVLAQQ